MGNQSFLNQNPGSVDPNRRFRKIRQEKATSGPLTNFLDMDMPLLIVIACLLTFGLVMVYSASWSFGVINGLDPSYILSRQAIWVLVGLIAAFIMSRIDYHHYRLITVPMIVIVVLMLLTVLVLSNARFGASRTLVGGSIQPSELAKLATIIYLSFWLFSKREQINEFSLGLFPMAIILGIICGFIVLQPDLSATFTIVFLGGLLFFLAGGDYKQIGLVIMVVFIIGWIMITISDTGRARVGAYISGLQDPKDASYHVQRAIEAFVRGGWFGSGIGNSATKNNGLPVPWTDSIFAVIGEETGAFGATVVIGLYLVFLWRGLSIANKAPDMLGKLLASGITIWIITEAVINMGVLVNLFPFAGNALPLMSAGGSNLFTVLVGIGILLNVSRQGNKKGILAGSNQNAVVDLRWRDRGGRVSRPHRPESHL
jgi:cell division protein FtsW